VQDKEKVQEKEKPREKEMAQEKEKPQEKEMAQEKETEAAQETEKGGEEEVVLKGTNLVSCIGISLFVLKGYRIKNCRSGRLDSTDARAIVCIAFTAAHRNSGREYGGCEQFESCISYVGRIYHFG